MSAGSFLLIETIFDKKLKCDSVELLLDTGRISFKNVEDEAIKNSFLKVLQRYETLRPYEIILKQKKVKGSTMQAQPVISFRSLFRGVEKYKVKLAIYVRDSEEILVKDLPEDIMTGWFAHELGHLVDYTSRSAWDMIFYGIKYLISDRFKKRTEHEADHIAIQKGFRGEIISAKQFILENDSLKDDYKDKIKKYYMSVEEVRSWEHDQVSNTPGEDL